ncbi:MAG: YqaE/Pmp3 family membrane protein [Bacteroidota bacterium]|nr:YqaE/Pmp3 family membrane protein [Bacteroidota bacterium]
MILIAILIPWLSFFLRGKIFSGLLCLILQITLIGWLPAAIWAVISRNNAKIDERLKRMEKNIITSQSK